ncbi:MAG: F0F1 ATP synthase subunit B [Bacteroidales bacterium]|nr:F0F1 ATP synthase subunit B [Bacteroidales bacterium]
MELVTPGLGLFFWMVVSFSIVLFLLGKFAWKPILNALKERENSIDEALQSAEKAREEMSHLKADNEQIIKEAKQQREKLIREAKEIKANIIEEATVQADKEAKKLIEKAKTTIQNEKEAAINGIKDQISIISVDIAEKIIKQELLKNKKQEELINGLLEEIKIN